MSKKSPCPYCDGEYKGIKRHIKSSHPNKPSVLHVDEMKANDWNPNRMDEETFESLKESIRHSNYLDKNPILVRDGDEDNEIVDGEQRWTVAKELGYEYVPVEVEEMSDVEARRRTVILNKDRGKLDFYPLGKIFSELNDGEMTQKEIGEKFGGFSPEMVSEISQIYKRLPDTSAMAKLSNRDKRRIARVRNEKFRKLLLESRVEENIQAKSLAKKASHLNDVHNYLEEKIEDESIIEEAIEEISDDVLKASLGKLRNDIDKFLEQRIEEKVIHGDALEELDNFKQEEFDCVITDPPYILSSKEGDLSFDDRKDMERDRAEWDYMNKDKFLDFSREWIEKSYKVLDDGGSLYIFTSDEFLSHLIDIVEDVGFETRTSLVWHKTNPEPQVRKRDYLSSTEYIVFAVKGDGFTFNWKGQKEMQNLVESPIVMGNERENHPTQKPVSIIEELLEVSTNTKDRVLDPFAGTGTTAIACQRQKRNWTMIEKEEEYVDIIKRRVK